MTILSLGTWMSPGGERLLRSAWANGVRYVDTAKSYGSEPMIGAWMNAVPVPRKNLFLVTKDQPNTPAQLIEQLDQRLEALQTDYVDLIFLHALGDRDFDVELQWPMSQEFKETADAIRKSGKAKFVGFSTHHPAASPAPPGRRARRVRRRHHAPEQPLDRARRQHEPRPRRLLQAAASG